MREQCSHLRHKRKGDAYMIMFVTGLLVIGGVVLYSTIKNDKTELIFEATKFFKIKFKSEKRQKNNE